MIRVIAFQYNNNALAEQVFAIRKNVFVEEQKVDAREEFDDHEKESTHYLAYYNDFPCGSARWRVTDKGIKLERFAVLKEYRNKGIGRSLVDHVLKDVLPKKKPVYLHSQESAMNLYLKAGFAVEGNLFMEANIRHYKMYYPVQ